MYFQSVVRLSIHDSKRMTTNTRNNHRHENSNPLEHTELLADVGETVRLLDLVLNDVESHRLGQGSSSHSNNEKNYLH